MIKLKKVISGGQTGADQAGLVAAFNCGLETGGWIPKGFLTEDGPNPDLAKYGIKEHSSRSYPPRTYANARDSDGTIRFATNFASAGEKCTLKAINQYKKPHLDIDVGNLSDSDISAIMKWLDENEIEVLNVAGNREKSSPGIHNSVVQFLTRVFHQMKT